MTVPQSDRLVFRLMELSDEEVLFAIWGDAETMRYCGNTVARERVPLIIEHNRVQYEKHGNAIFALVQKSDGRLIGICGGKLDEDNSSHVEVIIHLAKEAWGKGFATEAVRAYIAWLKKTRNASYIYGSVHPGNAASINMMKKCGFIQSGFRQYEDTGFVDEPYFELKL